MRIIRLGSTNLDVSGVSFGALPIQRISMEQATLILRRAYEGGINFFDTARGYTDSEEKIGTALSGVRDKIIIASKSPAKDGNGVTSDINKSLTMLKTDYIDVLQIHNPKTMPFPDDGTGRYEALLKAKEAGKIRHIGFTNHRFDCVEQAAKSGLYEVIQYPFSILSSQQEMDFVNRCRDLDIGFIAMKALSGGLVRHIPAAYTFMRRFENVVPIWGIQKMEELEQFLTLEAAPPAWDAAMQAQVEEERKELNKNFCRGCGYCLPCPEDIAVPMLARMGLFLARGPWKREVTPEAQAKYANADNCTNCGQCASRCPYELNPAALVKEHYTYYKQFVAEKQAAGEI